MIRPIHRFNSTEEAYDACQCDENIKTGDTLLILSEQVVGIADTWPVAVTLKSGNLHTVEGHNLGWEIHKLVSSSNIPADAYFDALKVAFQYGIEF